MTPITNGIKDACYSIRNHLTPKKILIGLALAPVVCFVASKAIAEAGSYWQRMQEEQRFQFEFNQNSQIEKIDCKLGTIVGGDFENFNQVPEDNLVHEAIHQYCDAKKLLSSDNLPTSLSKARKELKEVFEKGLIISRRILCHPGMFPEKSVSPDHYPEFKPICCPDMTPSICPWEPRPHY